MSKAGILAPPTEQVTPNEALALVAERLGVDPAEVQRWDADWPTAIREGVEMDRRIETLAPARRTRREL